MLKCLLRAQVGAAGAAAAHFYFDGPSAAYDPDCSAGVVGGEALEEGRVLPPVGGERGASREGAEIHFSLSRDQARVRRQLEYAFDGLGELLVDGHAGYVCWQVARVLDDELDAAEVWRELFGFEAGLQAGGRGGVGEGEAG